MPSQKIKEHFKFEKRAAIFLMGGKHIGVIGVVENIDGEKLIFKNEKNDVLETRKEHAFVIGKEKPIIKVQ